LCTLIFDEMSIMLYVGYDINEFLGFEMDSPELKIAEHVSIIIINKIINISIFRFPKGINTILSDKDTKDSRVVSYKNEVYNQALAMCKKS
jgi:hypothetical protein